MHSTLDVAVRMRAAIIRHAAGAPHGLRIAEKVAEHEGALHGHRIAADEAEHEDAFHGLRIAEGIGEHVGAPMDSASLRVQLST